MEYGLWGNSECPQLLPGPEKLPSGQRMGFALTPLIFTARDAPAGAQQPDILSLEGTAAGSNEAFLVQYRCYLPVHLTCAIQLRYPLRRSRSRSM